MVLVYLKKEKYTGGLYIHVIKNVEVTMKIFTSYYKHVTPELAKNYMLVQISRSKPDWFRYKCENLSCVHPSSSLLYSYKHNVINEQQYIDAYIEYLGNLNKKRLLDLLKYWSQCNEQKDVLLLCWEAPGVFCHRHLLAEWLGQAVIELEA